MRWEAQCSFWSARVFSDALTVRLHLQSLSQQKKNPRCAGSGLGPCVGGERKAGDRVPAHDVLRQCTSFGVSARCYVLNPARVEHRACLMTLDRQQPTRPKTQAPKSPTTHPDPTTSNPKLKTLNTNHNHKCAAEKLTLTNYNLKAKESKM